MDVIFERTGERRYAVILQVSGKSAQSMDPAPGFDENIPHDLVHYVVEAELALTSGVFGRAASGGGTFIPSVNDEQSPRERARRLRKQRRRETGLRTADRASQSDMAASERLASLCDLAWRRRHGQRPDPSRWAQPEPLSTADSERVKRVVARLDELAAVWKQLPVGGKLVLTWPGLTPSLAERSGDCG